MLKDTRCFLGSPEPRCKGSSGANHPSAQHHSTGHRVFRGQSGKVSKAFCESQSCRQQLCRSGPAIEAVIATGARYVLHLTPLCVCWQFTEQQLMSIFRRKRSCRFLLQWSGTRAWCAEALRRCKVPHVTLGRRGHEGTCFLYPLMKRSTIYDFIETLEAWDIRLYRYTAYGCKAEAPNAPSQWTLVLSPMLSRALRLAQLQSFTVYSDYRLSRFCRCWRLIAAATATFCSTHLVQLASWQVAQGLASAFCLDCVVFDLLIHVKAIFIQAADSVLRSQHSLRRLVLSGQPPQRGSGSPERL